MDKDGQADNPTMNQLDALAVDSLWPEIGTIDQLV